ncbi:hypothetical protein [Parvibaculum sp. MBR-TMA-1.3b-4.2]
MKNKLTDLNDHLFAQMERLSDEELTQEQIEQEVKRTEAIVSVSDQIVRNAALHVKVAELQLEYGAQAAVALPMLKGPEK